MEGSNMDRTTQAAIGTVVAIAMMIGWLLTGCSNEEEVSRVQFIINDAKIEREASVIIRDGRLMVAESFLEDIFHKQIEWQTIPQPNEAAYYSEQVAVLMYHDMAPVPLDNKIIAVDRFEKQMSLLKHSG